MAVSPALQRLTAGKALFQPPINASSTAQLWPLQR
jgi:hypothetical protein